MEEDRLVPVQGINDESEEISESFTCCICLDLLYKPVVLSCGHVSCFWCVHKSMSGLRESQCPICRHPYLHFPSICPMLHFLLIKIYPDAYKRREKQISEEEERIHTFSPQFDAYAWRSSGGQEQTSSQCTTSLDSGSLTNVEPIASWVNTTVENCSNNAQQDLNAKPNNNYLEALEERKNLQIKVGKTCKQISIFDVLCVACKQLTFHPIALNCGHVYCEGCILDPTDEKLKCQACHSHHPGGLPKVCLELDQFLEEQFPEEYALRRIAARPRQTISTSESPKSCNGEADKEKRTSSLMSEPSKTHFGVGCDYCGMYPIVGDRYQCQDCVEKIGFDLCGDCYNSRCKLPGRFNQQHRPEHKFKLKKPSFFHNYMLRLMAGRLSDDSAAVVFSHEDSEDGVSSPLPALAVDVPEDDENSVAISFILEDAAENQNDSQSNSSGSH